MVVTPFGSSETRNSYYRQLAERVRAIPGVRAVAAGTSLPLSSGAQMTVNEIRTALLEPSAHIAGGYSVAGVRLRNGQTVRGFVKIRSGSGIGLRLTRPLRRS